MTSLILRDEIPWFGKHSGYEQIVGYLADLQAIKIVVPRAGKFARYLGSATARLQGRMGRGATDLSELEFRLSRRLGNYQPSHILYMEHHLNVLRVWAKSPRDVVGTVHLPASVWKPEQIGLLLRLASALVLFQRDIPFFEKHIGKGRVKFIHHGADTEFFKPDASKLRMPLRILYSGVYLRNEAMLVRVLKKLAERNPDIRFDLLVPRHHRNSPALAPLQGHPVVTWHAGLNDAQLRELYQQSYLMLLPMNDSGANTAVVEALSSGLPIVTTDVGGIRDYGGESIFPIVANNDDDGMISLVEQYLLNARLRNEKGRKCRQFAEEVLAWPLVAQKHRQAYRELTA
jgi:glycosyltransferase involved in cell wall biosynthesis